MPGPWPGRVSSTRWVLTSADPRFLGSPQTSADHLAGPGKPGGKVDPAPSLGIFRFSVPTRVSMNGRDSRCARSRACCCVRGDPRRSGHQRRPAISCSTFGDGAKTGWPPFAASSSISNVPGPGTLFVTVEVRKPTITMESRWSATLASAFGWACPTPNTPSPHRNSHHERGR